jgi:hypothetical protein
MNIIGLDGKQYSWNPSANQAECSTRSSLHIKAKALLDEIFPHDRVFEEVSLPGSKTQFRKTVLRADFFIPNRNLLIEVHGEQHHKFNKFFFKNKMAFYKAKARDNEKREWCELNSIKLVEFNYNEDIDEWRRKI